MTGAVPQARRVALDGSADKNQGAIRRIVAISTGRCGNRGSIDEEMVRTLRVETWTWRPLPQPMEPSGVGARALLLYPLSNHLRVGTKDPDRPQSLDRLFSLRRPVIFTGLLL